jgi:hypothetical protein
MLEVKDNIEILIKEKELLKEQNMLDIKHTFKSK